MIHLRRSTAVDDTLSLAVDLLLQVGNNRALFHVAVALRLAIDFLPQRAETGGQVGGLGAERYGSCGAGGEELVVRLVFLTMRVGKL